MKVAVAIDSLKGSLSSLEAGEAVKDGILRAMPDAEVWVRPMADGGEGTVEALTLGMQGRLEKVTVTGPLGRPVQAVYGIVDEKKMAILEMSAAAGITLVESSQRNPLHTTTFGVGEMIKDAIAKGCRRFIVGIGGSATNDGGSGMLQALGFGLLNREGKQISRGAKGLENLVTITDENVMPELRECSFRIACDVTNPLCGPQGCSAVYGPQKGATTKMIAKMDAWLAHFAEVTQEVREHADPEQPGTGAAGGLGFAFLSFLDASLQSGIEIVLEETGLESYIRQADLVVTGEGRLDSQTVMGKAPAGVAGLAQKNGKKVIAFSGCVAEDARVCNAHGIEAYFPILRTVVPVKEALNKETARKNMTATAEQVFRLIKMLQ